MNNNSEHCTAGFVKPGRINMIIDGQFGSTGKGLIASKIAEDNRVDLAIASLSPNAGHTFYMPNDTSDAGFKKIITHLIPAAGIINKEAVIYLDAACIIDVDLFLRELKEFGIDHDRVFVHPRCAVVTQENRETDAKLISIASTTSGTGAARADKILRNNPLAQGTPELQPFIKDIDIERDYLDKGCYVLLESGQGVGLGLNFGFDYPHCTSRDVLPSNLMADTGVFPTYIGNICMSLRSYPIRVGNVKDADGNQIGYSGDCYPDQRELTWEELKCIPELTTVTKRVRRIFTWSNDQYNKALRLVKPTHVFLNFVNYIRNADLDTYKFIGQRKPDWMGMGPDNQDVKDFDYDAIVAHAKAMRSV